MKQYGYIECRQEWDEKGDPAGMSWTWVGSRIARVSLIVLSSDWSEIHRIGDNLIQIGPFRTRIVDRYPYLEDEALVMRDGLLGVGVAGWFALMFRIKRTYYGLLSWLKHHGHMTTREGERMSWRQFRLRYEPWSSLLMACPKCGESAVKLNLFNRAIQCHRCGHTVERNE